MARPKREITMARCAGAALLAAIEIYNKPTVEYREQTFALLVTNAWEVLLKARIVQSANGKVQSIYRRKRGSRLIDRDPETQEPRTISLRQALERTSVPGEVAANIKGLMLIRNTAAHLGTLEPAVQRKVLQFGTASIENFTKISRLWFSETFDTPYLLPLGFVGDATIVQTAVSKSQRPLLRALDLISDSSIDTSANDYSVTLHISVDIQRGLTGGGSIGLTNDPSAPKVSISDDEALGQYPATYSELIEMCKLRYPGFKRDRKFQARLREIKADANCAHERRLDPNKPTGQTKMFYNLEASVQLLDNEYGYSQQAQ